MITYLLSVYPVVQSEGFLLYIAPVVWKVIIKNAQYLHMGTKGRRHNLMASKWTISHCRFRC